MDLKTRSDKTFIERVLITIGFVILASLLLLPHREHWNAIVLQNVLIGVTASTLQNGRCSLLKWNMRFRMPLARSVFVPFAT